MARPCSWRNHWALEPVLATDRNRPGVVTFDWFSDPAGNVLVLAEFGGYAA